MKKFLIKTFNGMTYGLFATLIIGVILEQLSKLFGIADIMNPLVVVLKGLLGAGIGLGIAISLKKEGLTLVIGMIIGMLSSSFMFNYENMEWQAITGPANPVTVFTITVLVYLVFDKIMIKKTPIDLLLVPFVAIILTFIFTSILGYPIHYLMSLISNGISKATELRPVLMSIIISTVMGIILTSPISSAAIAISINLSGIAAGAAIVGTTVQMLGFGIQSIRDNNIGNVLSVAFGTAKLQFKNVLRNFYVWLPTIISSAILGPIYYLIFKLEGTKEGAGMGSSGLVGQLQLLEAMEYSTMSIIAVLSMFVVIPLTVFGFDLLFRKLDLIKAGDLTLEDDF